MIEKLRSILIANWHTLSHGSEMPEPEKLRVTKFCQRIVQPHTKVLFLITYKKQPLCIIKMMRGEAFNENLRIEKNAQQSVQSSGFILVPSVYFDGYIDRFYIYAEEVVEGVPPTKQAVAHNIKEIIQFIQQFPSYKTVATASIVSVLEQHIPEDSKHIKEHVDYLRKSDAVLKQGFTHGDFARPNLLASGNRVFVIDWERAGERPFWLMDAVRLLVRIKNVRNSNEWLEKGSPLLCQYTGVTSEETVALYHLFIIFEILYRKYPDTYDSVSNVLKI